MTSVDVCIPWRRTKDRALAFDRVFNFWQHFGHDIILADSAKGQPFNLARARNNAARKSKADVIIMADADTIPDYGAVQQAVALAAADPIVVWPFKTYRHIPGDSVGKADLLTIAPDHTYRDSVGGLFVTARDTYWALNGQDERFESRWGYDDSAFYLAARTLALTMRLDGTVYSFNHSADRDMSDDNPNKARYELYRYADGKRNVMRELIKL